MLLIGKRCMPGTAARLVVVFAACGAECYNGAVHFAKAKWFFIHPAPAALQLLQGERDLSGAYPKEGVL